MLILTRKVDQRIVIWGQGFPTVTLTVTELRDHIVRIGFHADNSVNVDREEIYLAKQRSVNHTGGKFHGQNAR